MDVIEEIEKFESKDIRICVFPQMASKNEWKWTAGIYVGNSKSAIWMSENDSRFFNSFKEGFNAVLKYLYDEKRIKKAN